MANSIQYTAVKLYDYKGNTDKRWFVGFAYNGKRYQVRMGLNFIKNKSDRLALGKNICRLIENALADGWDPSTRAIDAYLSKEAEVRKGSSINQKTIIEAIDFALSNGSWSHKTKLCYSSTANFYKDAAKAIGLNNTPIQDITKQHVMQLTNQIKKSRDWSNKAVNKNVGYFAGILKIVKDWDIIPHNPAHDIAKLPESESEKYVPYTSKEKKDIKDALLPNHFRFYVLFMIVYHTGIRPKEVLSLKISDINLNQDEIKIVPDLKEGNSKTKNIRHVPINPHLKELLLQLGTDQYPSSHYVFGSPYGNGQNHVTGHKRQLGMSHPAYFKPSLNKIPRNNITKLWKELIWEGAGVHKYLYAAKHTGGDDKILAGVDLDALRDLYGHSSKQMTEKYVSRLQEVHKKKIIEKSPDFL